MIRLPELSGSLQLTETSSRKAKQEKLGEKWHTKYRMVVLHAVNMRHGTNGFTSHPKEEVLMDFYRH
jgi:hypothetical protein